MKRVTLILLGALFSLVTGELSFAASSTAGAPIASVVVSPELGGVRSVSQLNGGYDASFLEIHAEGALMGNLNNADLVDHEAKVVRVNTDSAIGGIDQVAAALDILSLTGLLDRGVSPNELNGAGELPLVLVLTQEGGVSQNQFRVASLLIEYKADVNLPQMDGTYPIHAACEHTHDIQLLNLLLKNKANVDEQNHNKQTPLHLVAAVGNEHYLRRLIDAQASMHSRDSRGGYVLGEHLLMSLVAMKSKRFSSTIQEEPHQQL
jgi:ankyrin repeat protein